MFNNKNSEEGVAFKNSQNLGRNVAMMDEATSEQSLSSANSSGTPRMARKHASALYPQISVQTSGNDVHSSSNPKRKSTQNAYTTGSGSGCSSSHTKSSDEHSSIISRNRKSTEWGTKSTGALIVDPGLGDNHGYNRVSQRISREIESLGSAGSSRNSYVGNKYNDVFHPDDDTTMNYPVKLSSSAIHSQHSITANGATDDAMSNYEVVALGRKWTKNNKHQSIIGDLEKEILERTGVDFGTSLDEGEGDSFSRAIDSISRDPRVGRISIEIPSSAVSSDMPKSATYRHNKKASIVPSLYSLESYNTDSPQKIAALTEVDSPTELTGEAQTSSGSQIASDTRNSSSRSTLNESDIKNSDVLTSSPVLAEHEYTPTNSSLSDSGNNVSILASNSSSPYGRMIPISSQASTPTSMNIASSRDSKTSVSADSEKAGFKKGLSFGKDKVKNLFGKVSKKDANSSPATPSKMTIGAPVLVQSPNLSGLETIDVVPIVNPDISPEESTVIAHPVLETYAEVDSGSQSAVQTPSRHSVSNSFSGTTAAAAALTRKMSKRIGNTEIFRRKSSTTKAESFIADSASAATVAAAAAHALGITLEDSTISENESESKDKSETDSSSSGAKPAVADDMSNAKILVSQGRLFRGVFGKKNVEIVIEDENALKISKAIVCLSAEDNGILAILNLKRPQFPMIALRPNLISRNVTSLTNSGNDNGYVNSVIQCLAGYDFLASYFLSRTFTVDLNKKSATRGAIALVYDGMMTKLYSDLTLCSAEFLKDEIIRIAPHLSDAPQQDAHDFLCVLLSGLHSDLNRSRENSKFSFNEKELRALPSAERARLIINDAYLKSNSIISDLFQGLFESTVRCYSCGYTSVTYETFTSISVPVGTTNTDIIGCFSSFMAPEDLESAFLCSGCRHPTRASKQIRISKYPEHLIVQLNRFDKNDDGSYSKLNTRVTFCAEPDQPLLINSKNVSLSTYLTQSHRISRPGQNISENSTSEADNSNQRSFVDGVVTTPALGNEHSGQNAVNDEDQIQYILNSVVHHKGDSISSGHYYASVYNAASNCWYEKDNDSVQRLPLDGCNGEAPSTAYILFFKKTKQYLSEAATV